MVSQFTLQLSFFIFYMFNEFITYMECQVLLVTVLTYHHLATFHQWEDQIF